MSANSNAPEIAVGEFIATLSDAAAQDALKHGTQGLSIDVELEVWQALRTAFARARAVRPDAAGSAECRGWRERLVAELADAAYQVMLRHGIAGSFLDAELSLFHTLRGALEQLRPAAVATPRERTACGPCLPGGQV
jgi:hypothetical protein